MQFFLIIVVVILILFGIIHFQNDELKITMDFITWTFEEKPLSLILAVPFLAGIIAGAFLFVPPWMKRANLARHQKKQIHELEAEIAEAAGPAAEEREKESEGEVIVEGYKEEV